MHLIAGTNNGTVTSSGAEVTVLYTTIFGSVHCKYVTNGTDIGRITSATTNTAHAVLDLESASIPVGEGSHGLCGTTATMTGKYKITTPTGLSVDASALTTITTAYTGAIEAESEGSISLTSSGLEVTCGKSSLKAIVEQHGSGVTTGGKVSSLSFSECTRHVTVLKQGSLEVHLIAGTNNGTVTSSGAEVTVLYTTIFGSVHCKYVTNGTDIGRITSATTNTAHAVLDLESASIPVGEGSHGLCGTTATMTGKYKITTPTGLSVDASALTTITTAYTGAIEAESEGSISLTSSGLEVTCGKSSLKAIVEQHGSGVTTGGKVSSLSFSECTRHVTVLKQGSLEVHLIAGTNNGTVTSSGAEVTVLYTTIFGSVHCKYVTNGTDIGRITSATTNTAHAVLDLESASIPVGEGSHGLCGTTATMTGKYKITTPTGLSVDA